MTQGPSPASPRCAQCGTAVVDGVRCPRCGWPLPPAPRSTRAVELAIGDWGPAAAGAVLGFVFGVTAAHTLGIYDPAWVVLLCAAVGSGLGVLAIGALMRRLRAAKLDWRVRRYMNAVPRVAIGAVEGGRVRVRGRVFPIRPVQSRGGVECVAWEHRPAGPSGALALHAEGGVFELDDGSGVRALVDATHLGVPSGLRVGAERVIVAGAEVELVGHARPVTTSEDSTALGSHRAAARRVEIVGSPQDPVLIRQIAPPPAASTAAAPTVASTASRPAPGGVRVAVDASRSTDTRAPGAPSREALEAHTPPREPDARGRTR